MYLATERSWRSVDCEKSLCGYQGPLCGIHMRVCALLPGRAHRLCCPFAFHCRWKWDGERSFRSIFCSSSFARFPSFHKANFLDTAHILTQAQHLHDARNNRCYQRREVPEREEGGGKSRTRCRQSPGKGRACRAKGRCQSREVEGEDAGSAGRSQDPQGAERLARYARALGHICLRRSRAVQFCRRGNG